MRNFFELVRLPAVFTAPADVFAGLALAAVWGVEASPLTVVYLVLASALVYCAGMAANDIFDRGIDQEERPGRPLPSGRISLGAAWSFVILAQGLGLGLGALVSPVALAAVGATVVATYLYNGVFKASIVGPVFMGLCRYGNALIGLSIVGFDRLDGYLLVIPLSTFVFVVMLTAVSRFEVDGGNGGRGKWALFGLVTAGGLSGLWSGLGVLPVRWGAFLALIPVFWLYASAARAWTSGTGSAFRGVVMAGIFGVALVNAVIALSAGQWVYGLLVCGFAAVGKVFGRWFYAT